MSAALRPTNLQGRGFQLLALAGGAVWGAALARWLFESWPPTFGFLSTWPGAILLAVCGAVAAVWLQNAKPESGETNEKGWAALPLFLPALSLFAPEVD
ncbi:MAG: hypothetical protein JNL09_10335, partial [Anaerolineales bacterium]|nr:hypothetical protein [Anaerolineales bacterium]